MSESFGETALTATKEKNMKATNRRQDKWVTVYSRETERKFFFYATVVLLVVYIVQRVLS